MHGTDDIRTSGGYFHMANVFYRQNKLDVAFSLYNQVRQYHDDFRVKKSRSCQTVRLYLLYLRPISWHFKHFLQVMVCFITFFIFLGKIKTKKYKMLKLHPLPLLAVLFACLQNFDLTAC